MTEPPVLDLELPDPDPGVLESDPHPLVAQVVLLPSPAGLPDSLTYSIPKPLRGQLTVGMPVLAPLGGREQLGYVISVEELPAVPETFRLRPILKIPRAEQAFDESSVALLRRVAREYRSSLSEALPLWVPERYGAELESRIHLGEWDGTIPPRTGLLTRQVLEALYQALVEAGGTLTRDALHARIRNPMLPRVLQRARTEGWIRQEQTLLPPKVHPRTVPAVRLPLPPASPTSAPAPPAARGRRQQEVLEYLRGREPGEVVPRSELVQALGLSGGVLGGMVKSGLLEP
ncbi:MAG: hypothetical protein FJX77_01990, partial [Armatimonadetes bacterium]|nr:hypothetical protein [Armatimonadota bacterium]